MPLSHRYDAGKDGFIDLMELKLMMEKLGAPQTHLGLKNMIKEVDEDLDSKLSFREVRGQGASTVAGRNFLLLLSSGLAWGGGKKVGSELWWL